MADTIKMRREDGKEADVHPSMVAEYVKGGYVAVEVPVESPRKAAKAKK